MRQQVRQVRIGAVDGVQEPEQGHVAGAELGDLVRALPAPTRQGVVLGLQHADQALNQSQQDRAGTQVQAGRDKAAVEGELAGGVALQTQRSEGAALGMNSKECLGFAESHAETLLLACHRVGLH